VLNVTTNVVLVPEVLKTLVSPVVKTYSGGTTNVPKNVQKDGIKTSLPTPVCNVTILVEPVTVQKKKNVTLVSHHISYTSTSMICK